MMKMMNRGETMAKEKETEKEEVTEEVVDEQTNENEEKKDGKMGGAGSLYRHGFCDRSSGLFYRQRGGGKCGDDGIGGD